MKAPRGFWTIGILLAAFGVGFFGFYSLRQSKTLPEPESAMSISAIPAPSRNIEERTTSSAPSAAAASPLTDQSVKLLAYAAASDDKAARDTLDAQAAKGVPVAEYGLGLFYFTKAQELNPVTPCFAASGSWLRKNSPEAAREREKMDRAAMSGLKGDATETKKLCETASTWFEKAASAGDPAAQAKLGQEFYSAAARLKMMASIVSSNGDSAADQETKDDLNRGGGVLKLACAEALRWLNQAAAAHEPNAESTLASGYLVGVACVKRDQRKALDWYTKAHDDGDLSASVDLASLYWEDGNFTDAHHWIATAEREGAVDEETSWSIVQYYKLGDVNEEKADYWRQRAESLDAEEDEKYPALKLIHEREMQAAGQEPSSDE